MNSLTHFSNKRKGIEILKYLRSGMVHIKDYEEAISIVSNSGMKIRTISDSIKKYKKRIESSLDLTNDQKEEFISNINRNNYFLKTIVENHAFKEPENITEDKEIYEIFKNGSLPIKNYKEKRIMLKQSGLSISVQRYLSSLDMKR